MDFNKLKSPIGSDSPCGENLEDTQLLASFDGYRLFGQGVPFDPVPDWREIKTKSLEALDKSKDVRLLAHLAAAELRLDGMSAFAGLLQVAAHWLGEYWDSFFPLVDDDAILRRNALNCFADRMAIVDGLRRLPLVAHRQLGSISLRDLEIIGGQLAPTEADSASPDQTQVDALFAAASDEDLARLRTDVEGALGALKTIEERMRSAGGSEAAPNFDALVGAFLQIQRAIQPYLEARGGAASPAGGADASVGGQAGEGVVAVGAIRSRQDAIRALDAVANFFRQNEPSSPVPIFIERAKRLVSKDFLSVLADIAPDALGQAKMVGGIQDE